MRLLAAAILLSSLNAAAQEFPDDYTQLLLPVTATAVHGAHGSVWTTEWMLFNGTNGRLFVGGPFPYLGLSPVITDNDVAAGATKRLFVAEARPGFDGAFVYVPTADLDEVSMSLRVRDKSVNAQSHGTSIPIVPMSAFKPRVRLIDIPADPAYRAMLRIYGSTEAPRVVRVAVYDPSKAAPIEELDVTLQENLDFGLVEHAPRPAYAQVDPLSAAARHAGGKVRVEISAPGGEPIWAFVSVSHNQTQQVTAVVP
jgi:hypothetical protein